MTSDDTHEQTVEYLKENNNFGLEASRLHILKQQKVAAYNAFLNNVKLD